MKERVLGKGTALHRRCTVNGMVRIGPLMGIPDVLRELGLEPEPVFTRAGFNLEQFSDPDAEIDYVHASRLLASCVAATGCQHFGLLVGERAGPSTLGIAGFMLRSAPDVGTALQELLRNLDLHDQGGVPTLLTRNNVVQFGYAIHQSGVEAADQIYDLAIAAACNIMRGLCGADWEPDEVQLSRRTPLQLAPYKRVFHAPIRFNADQSAVVFPVRWLDHKIASADALLHRHLEQEANELHALREGNSLSELRGLLRKSVVSGDCTFSHVARQLGIHERTLHRRFHELGTSFRHELEDIRQEMAQQLLAKSTMPIVRIAAALNYADASTFSRAFKHWSGSTPAQWRSHNRSFER